MQKLDSTIASQLENLSWQSSDRKGRQIPGLFAGPEDVTEGVGCGDSLVVVLAMVVVEIRVVGNGVVMSVSSFSCCQERFPQT